MTAQLLDANALIALVVAEHEHHDRVSVWAADAGELAVTPIVEGALLRYLIRIGESAAHAVQVLGSVRQVPSVIFWPDDASYLDLDLKSVQGHRQVTDAYLAGLARRRGTTIATFDRGLVELAPDVAVLIS